MGKLGIICKTKSKNLHKSKYYERKRQATRRETESGTLLRLGVGIMEERLKEVAFTMTPDVTER